MRFFLCDDEQSILNKYNASIRELCGKYEITPEISTYTDGNVLIHDFAKTNFNGILYLDINMPKIDGMSVAESLKKAGYKGEIIFLTVSKEHFLTAFDVGAFNYVLKDDPDHTRFEEVFVKAVRTVLAKRQEYIMFSTAGETRNIPVNSIHYFEVLDRIITVHYGKGKGESFSFFSTMGKIENQLIGKNFIRIHRAFLVSIQHIQSLSANEVGLIDGTRLPVSRKNYQNVKAALSKREDAIK
jgi:DNA-binding LytR/AlgR family response regulator